MSGESGIALILKKYLDTKAKRASNTGVAIGIRTGRLGSDAPDANASCTVCGLLKTWRGRPDFAADARDLRVRALAGIHRDPFDRMRVAQCIEDKLMLLAVDRALRRYGGIVRTA